MTLRDIPDELENDFLTLATEARSPAANTDQLRAQIIILVERLSAIPETPLTLPEPPLPEPCGYDLQIAILEEDLARERATIANLNRLMNRMEATTAAAPTHAHATKIPDPDKFDGDREFLPNFLLQLRLKAPTLPDEQARLRYAISLLKDRALSQIRPYVRAGRVDLDNLEALIAKLEAAFGDPDRVATAEGKIMTVKQGNKDFSTFFAEFSKYAADLEWNDTAKRSVMRSALCYELKVDLIAQDEPADFDEWLALLQRLDNKRRRITVETRSAPRSSSSSSYHSAASRNPLPTTSRTTATPRTPATNSRTPTTTATGTAPGPMDLSSGKRKLTPEEKKIQIEEGRCLYCGGLGHMARQCPLAPPPRPLRTAGAAVIADVVEEGGVAIDESLN